jgi:hypothetical protein
VKSKFAPSLNVQERFSYYSNPNYSQDIFHFEMLGKL